MIAGRIQHREQDSNEQNSAQDHIQVDALSASEWRISDARAESTDASSLIGFVEENNGVYEVIRFSDPMEFSFATSLDAAVALVTDAVRQVAAPRPVVQIGDLGRRARGNAAS
jgi:hypothetical protein